MPNYRRWKAEGAVYFFTIVTHERRGILTTPFARSCLRTAFRECRARHPFELPAIVLLPDHLHLVIRLAPGECDYSKRISSIKGCFTRVYLGGMGAEGTATASRRRQRYRGVWQKRFYEHCIRDSRDNLRHIDYIHANPVKHGLVRLARDWPWSTFHRYVKLGEYPLDWCGHVELPGEVYLEPDTW